MTINEAPGEISYPRQLVCISGRSLDVTWIGWFIGYVVYLAVCYVGIQSKHPESIVGEIIMDPKQPKLGHCFSYIECHLFQLDVVVVMCLGSGLKSWGFSDGIGSGSRRMTSSGGLQLPAPFGWSTPSPNCCIFNYSPSPHGSGLSYNDSTYQDRYSHNVSPYPQTMRTKSRHSPATMRHTNVCLGIRTGLQLGGPLGLE
jgi:hypothetical protein